MRRGIYLQLPIKRPYLQNCCTALALLPRLDELFYADHRGITSLGHCDSLPLMSLLAERLAAAIEALFPKM